MHNDILQNAFVTFVSANVAVCLQFLSKLLAAAYKMKVVSLLVYLLNRNA